MLLAFVALFVLHNIWSYRILFYASLLFLLIPFVDFLLGKIGVHVKILRLITHFIAMNFALLVGFFNALNGVEKGVWQPSKRY